MDTKKLRQKILDLAIHGKLVPQDPNDEPASVLLERIRKEKEQLIKEGKIKAPKKSKSAGDTSHYPKEGPWELPEGWCWTSIGEVFNLQAGKFVSAEDIHEESAQYPYRCFGGNGIRGYVSVSNRIGDFPIIGRQGALCGNINFASGEFYATEHAVVVESLGGTDPTWARYLLEQLNLNQYATATAQPGLSVKTINEVAIPLPPIREQHEISNAISQYLAIIADLHKTQEGFRAVIDQTKSRILDLAIHGKLVHQDPFDEPALELLKRIKPDFQPSHNLHYEGDFPNGWVLASSGEISNYGHCISVPVEKIGNDDWVLELEDIEKDNGRILQRLSKKDRKISGIRHQFKKGQILYSKLRTYLNKVLIADEDGFCTTEIIPITPIDGVNALFLIIVLRSQYFLDYTQNCCYGVKMPRLGTNDAKKAFIPLPPFEEQGRIVAAVKGLFLTITQIGHVIENQE